MEEIEIEVINFSDPEEVLRLKDSITEESLRWLALNGVICGTEGCEEFWERQLMQTIEDFKLNTGD